MDSDSFKAAKEEDRNGQSHRGDATGGSQRAKRSWWSSTSDATWDQGACECSDSDWSNWAWKARMRSGPDEADEFRGLEYADSHCHLDYILLNERHGGLQWMMKSQLCWYWKNGDCPFGDKCDYAHGEQDVVGRIPLQPADVEAFAARHETLGEAVQVPLPPAPPAGSSYRRRRGGPKLRCMITNCCETDAIQDHSMFIKIAERLLQGSVYVTFGCHPHNYRDYSDAYEAKLLAALEASGDRAVAWGECGLDYHKNAWDLEQPGGRATMMDVFVRQARVAVARGLPLVVHSRDAEEDTVEVLRGHLPREHAVHIHAYQNSLETMWEILRLMPNSMVGVSGAVLFQTSTHIHDIARECPLDRLLLETDSPYLATEPRAILKMARRVAELKALTTEQVVVATTSNCERFYRIPQRGG